MDVGVEGFLVNFFGCVVVWLGVCKGFKWWDGCFCWYWWFVRLLVYCIEMVIFEFVGVCGFVGFFLYDWVS